MYAFGDAKAPRADTVDLVESIVLDFIMNLVYSLVQSAEERDIDL